MAETLRIATNGKFYDIDPAEFTPKERLAFEAKVKSGAFQIHPPAIKMPAPQIIPTGNSRPNPASIDPVQGLSLGEYQTDNENKADTQAAKNRLRTFLGDLPGAVVSGMRGGIPGVAGSVGMNAAMAAMLPRGALDQTNGDTAATATGGLMSSLLGPKLPIKNPIVREAVNGGLAGMTGETMRQLVTGDPGIDPTRIGIAGTFAGVMGGGTVGAAEAFRKSTKSGVLEQVMDYLRGKPGGVLPQEVKVNPTYAKNATAAVKALDTRIPPALVKSQEAALKSRFDNNETAIARLTPGNLAPVVSPPISLRQQAPLTAFDEKIKAASTNGEKAYWLDRKANDVVRRQEYEQARKLYETAAGSPVAPGAGQLPDYVPKNRGLIREIDKSTETQLNAIDAKAEAMRKQIDVQQNNQLSKQNPLSKRYPALTEKIVELDVEYMNLAKQRKTILDQQRKQLTSLLEDDQNRLEAVKKYGYDKVQYDADLSDLRQKVTASQEAIPVAVRTAMDATGGKDNQSLITWARGAQAPELQEVKDYLTKAGKWEDTKLAMMNDFFETARDPITRNLDRLPQAMEQYGSPEKLQVIFGTPQAAEKFRVLTEKVGKLSKSQAKNGVEQFVTGGAVKTGLTVAGGLLLYGADMTAHPLKMLAAGSVMAVALPRVLARAMDNPAFYHAFKDVVENSAKGIAPGASRALGNYLKDIEFAITPQEAAAQQKAAEDERNAKLRALYEAEQAKGQGQQQQQ